MLSYVYEWIVTLSNLFLVGVICWVGFRGMPEERRSPRRTLLRGGLLILMMGELVVLAYALRTGPPALGGRLFLQAGGALSLAVSATVLQTIVKAKIQRSQRRRRNSGDDWGGRGASGVTTPLGPSPLVLSGRDAKPWPLDR